MPIYRAEAFAAGDDAQTVSAWHAQPGAAARLSPPWDPEFAGALGQWQHGHRVHDVDDGARIEDTVQWTAPLFPWRDGVRSRVQQAIPFRHHRAVHDLGRLRPYRGLSRLRVLISGASGLVGTALTAFLSAGGHQVVPLVRSRDRPGIPWSVARAELDAAALEGFDAVVHLAGAPISDNRWDAAERARIRDSRVDGTRLLAGALAGLQSPPRVLISGSAVGAYGDGGAAELSEDAPLGDTFLAGVCREWEAAAQPAQAAGIRVVALRTGFVLSPRGGYLRSMLPLFRAGGGGPVGSGTQYVPWIHIDDEVALIHWAIREPWVTGPLNASAPLPVPQVTFARTLGRVLRRPAIAPVPAAAIRLILGRDRADELALQGQRAVPSAALAHGFPFTFPTLEPALRHLLGRTT